MYKQDLVLNNLQWLICLKPNRQNQPNQTLLNSLKFDKWLNSSIWPINGILTSATNLGQSGPGSNGNEKVLYFSESSKYGGLPLDGLVSYPGHLLEKGLYIYRGTVYIFSSPSRSGWVHSLLRCVRKKMWLVHL